MDVNEFLAVSWLREESADGGIDQHRVDIAAQRGWSTDWYASDEGLTELFSFLDAAVPLHTSDGRTRTELLDELAEAGDPGRQEAWLATVEREVYWSIPENRYSAPEYSEPYGMTYRYDRLREDYEWQEPAEPDVWLTQEQAEARMAAEVREQPPADTGYSAAAWDESWQMLYRVGPAGAYEYAYSDDRVTVRSGTGWLSYDEVAQAAGPAAEVGPAAEARDGAQATAVLADLTLDGLDRVAEQAPELMPLLCSLPADELDLLLAEAMTQAAAAAT
jgi:hypothetical protein